MCTDINLQLIVLGAGDRWCEDELLALSRRLPNLRVYIGYDDALSHLIEAGSDFFLMPSRYEPCGLNQMYSLLYGTLPIVRNTGGLADTVENYDEQTGAGTGFVLNLLTPESIYNTVDWAVNAWFKHPDHITEMRKRGMAKDFSWDTSARQYLEVYQKAIDNKNKSTFKYKNELLLETHCVGEIEYYWTNNFLDKILENINISNYLNEKEIKDLGYININLFTDTLSLIPPKVRIINILLKLLEKLAAEYNLIIECFT